MHLDVMIRSPLTLRLKMVNIYIKLFLNLAMLVKDMLWAKLDATVRPLDIGVPILRPVFSNMRIKFLKPNFYS